MRFGLVGLGWAGCELHTPALKSVRQAELVGGCDAAPDRRRDWQRRTRTPAFESFEELIERAAPDAVVIATPPDLHAELCDRALDARLHVFCEKPFVESVPEADALLARAERVDLRVAVNHHFREQPIFAAVREAVRSGRHGRLAFLQLWQTMDLAPWQESVAWRAAAQHRSLWEGGVHLVDLAVEIFDAMPEAVYARHASGPGGVPGADAINLLTLEFPGGRLAQLTIDRRCAAGTRYAELRADCERASLRASIGGRAMLQVGAKRGERTGVRLELATSGMAWSEIGTSRRVLARNGRRAAQRATGVLLEQFVAAIRSGEEPPSSAREARDLLAVIEAAYECAQSGRRVEIGRAERIVSEASPDANQRRVAQFARSATR